VAKYHSANRFPISLLNVLLFDGARLFNVPDEGTGYTPQETEYACDDYRIGTKSGAGNQYWNYAGQREEVSNGAEPSDGYDFQCGFYKQFCNSDDRYADDFKGDKGYDYTKKNEHGNSYYNDACMNAEQEHEGNKFNFMNWEDFTEYCLDAEECKKHSYIKSTLVFNAFIFAQLFNEYNARILGDELNMFKGIETNPIFIGVTLFSIGCQIFLVEIGGLFVGTSPLSWDQWLITVALGAISIPWGIGMRFIPVVEDPESFFDSAKEFESREF